MWKNISARLMKKEKEIEKTQEDWIQDDTWTCMEAWSQTHCRRRRALGRKLLWKVSRDRKIRTTQLGLKLEDRFDFGYVEFILTFFSLLYTDTQYMFYTVRRGMIGTSPPFYIHIYYSFRLCTDLSVTAYRSVYLG